MLGGVSEFLIGGIACIQEEPLLNSQDLRPANISFLKLL